MVPEQPAACAHLLTYLTHLNSLYSSIVVTPPNNTAIIFIVSSVSQIYTVFYNSAITDVEPLSLSLYQADTTEVGGD